MDEVSPSCETTVCELRDGFYRTIVIKPEDFGMVRGAKEEIVGGTPAENAALTRAILSGEVTGTKKNAVLLNAGCAIYAAGKASDIAEGVRIAEEKIASGEALAVLDKFIRVSNEEA
jgi:anthranilate phosphoribosyltransferase